MKDSSKLLLGFMAGVAAGVGIYALAQTDEGKDILKKAKKQADELAKNAKDLVDKAKQKVNSAQEDFLS